MSGLAASPFGVLVGLAMGAFGGGGSVIAIPILVYLVDQDLRAAQATALVIVAGAAVVGVWAHISAGRLRWRAGLAFGSGVAVAAFAGSLASRSIDPDLLLLAFAPLMIAAAASLLVDHTGTVREMVPWRYGVRPLEVARFVGFGLAAGAVIGVFGVGGGLVIVPALILLLGFSTGDAIATSLLIVLMGSLPALAERIASGDVDWAVAAPFGVTAIAGSLAGERLVARAEGAGLRQAFAALVVATAIYTGVSSAIALA